MKNKIPALVLTMLMLASCSDADSSRENISSASTATTTTSTTAPASQPDQRDDIITPTVNMPPQDTSILSDEGFIAAGGKDIYDLLGGRFPVYSGTDAAFCPTGEIFYARLLEELKTAEHTVEMEYFIISEGEMLDGILEVFRELSAKGVKIRVLCDGLIVEDEAVKAMTAAGAECKPYTAPAEGSVNNRDHRKFTIIDGKTAFTGGANLADEYINLIHPYGHWEDCAVMLKGSAVQSCSALFEQQWGSTETPPAPEAVPAEGWIMPIGESPFDGTSVRMNTFADMLTRAKDHVYITAPYLTISTALEELICRTAQRGVDVVIIVPGISDKEYSEILARMHYKALVQSGVRLYRYDPGFIHAKIYSSDGVRALVGSMNLNSRSFVHDFECGAYMFACPCIETIDAEFIKLLDDCTQITPDKIKEPTDAEKLKSKLLENLAPMM